jgi:UDPglucose 6-dehydrogenase
LSKIAVVGGGYVGLVTASCLAKLGHKVVCIEVDVARLQSLKRGHVPIYEPGLNQLISSAVAADRLSFTGSYPEALHGTEFAFICVNTPAMDDGSADIQNVLDATLRIIEHANRTLILVLKSTVPVGTADQVEKLSSTLARERLPVVSNPEFLRQGSAVQDFLKPDRIVIGADDPHISRAVSDLYAGVDSTIINCSRSSAELAKYAANAILATRISFMNEVAALCEVSDADIEEVAVVLAGDRRIGQHYLSSGIGWGGSCFSKDVKALQSLALEHGLPIPIIRGAYETNSAQRLSAHAKISRAIDGMPEPVVGILGLAFKPNTDDLREAPSIEIARMLLSQGVQIRAHDPVAMSNARRLLPDLTFCEDAYHVAQGADVLFLATEWSDYMDLDWRRMAGLLRGRSVVDGRNALHASSITRSGLNYLSFGRTVHSRVEDEPRSLTRSLPALRDAA